MAWNIALSGSAPWTVVTALRRFINHPIVLLR
jgi:hypothetical protein